MKYLLFFLIAIGFAPNLLAQDTLSLEQAITYCLSQNYNLQISQKNVQQSQVLATKGNAGLMPTLRANANVSYSNNNTKIIFAGGGSGPNEITQNGAGSYVTGASLSLNYRLFGGSNAKNNYQKSSLLVEQRKAEEQQQIQTIIRQLAESYYQMAKAQEDYRLAQDNLNISLERWQRLKNKQDFGVANRLDVLNAEVDLNSDSVSLFSLRLQLDNARRNLNNLMNQPLEFSFAVEPSVTAVAAWSLEEVKTQTLAQNAELQGLEIQQKSRDIDLKIAEGSRLPTLDWTSSYGYSRTENEVGLLLVNRNLGFNTGLTLSFDIFDGQRKQSQIANARIANETAELRHEELKNRLLRDVENAYATLENRAFILRMEEKNIRTAQVNFERSQEQYRFGQITSTQFREAQTNLLQSKNRLNAARLDLKIAELELLRLSNTLLSEAN